MDTDGATEGEERLGQKSANDDSEEREKIVKTFVLFISLSIHPSTNLFTIFFSL